jgi:hypothetical protein
MKNKILNIVLIVGIIITVLLLGTIFADYNLNRTISACIVGQKQISKSFDLKKSKKLCEQKIKKMN